MKRLFKIFSVMTILTCTCLAGGSPWSDWPQKTFISALLTLKDMRKSLERSNLINLSEESDLEAGTCENVNKRHRQPDGRCTDLQRPRAGVAGSLLGRNIKPVALAKASLQNEERDPDPRTLSRELLTRHEFKASPRLNLLGAAWIQFMVHDWFAHEDLGGQEAHFLKLDANDPFRQKYGQDFMVFTKTKPVSTGKWHSAYVNKVTQWWDGSQIYGSDQETLNHLRTFEKGQMRTQNGFLPVESNQEITGANPNWWVGLSLFHTLFVKEHNAIAKRLSEVYPQMSDEELFQKTRLINVAVMAKIHALEFSQVELDHPVTRFGTKVNWYGITTAMKDSQNDHNIPVKSFIEKLFPHSATLQGIIGGETRDHGVAFSQTTELSSVYRYHTLLPESVKLVSNKGEFLEEIPLAQTRFAQSFELGKSWGHATLLRSFGANLAGDIRLNNFPPFLQDIEIPVMGPIDLGALDIFRDRERNVPRYNEFRRQVGLKPLTSIDQLTNDKAALLKLKKLYHNDIERVDLQIGMMAESQRPEGLIFGETQFQIISVMASRRLQADRFFTKDYNATYYTDYGLQWIDQMTLKQILLRHYPELASSLAQVKNPFRPWKLK